MYNARSLAFKSLPFKYLLEAILAEFLALKIVDIGNLFSAPITEEPSRVSVRAGRT